MTIDQINVMYASTKHTEEWLKKVDIAICGQNNRMKYPNAQEPQYSWGRCEPEMSIEIVRIVVTTTNTDGSKEKNDQKKLKIRNRELFLSVTMQT